MLLFAVCHQIIPSLSLLIECDTEIKGYFREPMPTTPQLWRRTLVGLDAEIGKQLRAQTPGRSWTLRSVAFVARAALPLRWYILGL